MSECPECGSTDWTAVEQIVDIKDGVWAECHTCLTCAAPITRRIDDRGPQATTTLTAGPGVTPGGV